MSTEPISGDPVCEDDGYWYFWDETWTEQFGPFSSESEARECLAAYCKHLDN